MQEYRQRLKNLKLETIPKTEAYFEFDDVVYYNNMTFDKLSDGELQLLHTILHQKYSTKSMDLDKIIPFHTSVKMEMEKRNLSHKRVDKLDDYDGNTR